jgi:hypothetical protein
MDAELGFRSIRDVSGRPLGACPAVGAEGKDTNILKVCWIKACHNVPATPSGLCQACSAELAEATASVRRLATT